MPSTDQPPNGNGAVRVSVLITTYQHEAYIARALDSVLAQEGAPAFEILVGDDFSADGTRAIVRRYAEDHPDRIRAWLPPTNLGNQGKVLLDEMIRGSRGEYIAMLDGDDFWISPQKLRRQVEYMDAHPGCVMSFHNVLQVHEDGAQASTLWHPRDEEVRVELPSMLVSTAVPACSPVFRREVVDPLPAWYFDLPWGDWQLEVMAAQQGDIAYLPDVMGVYWIHGRGMWSGLDPLLQLESFTRCYEGLEGILEPGHEPFRLQILAGNWAQRAVSHARRGERKAACRCAYESFRAWPSDPRRRGFGKPGWLVLGLKVLLPVRINRFLKRLARNRGGRHAQ